MSDSLSSNLKISKNFSPFSPKCYFLKIKLFGKSDLIYEMILPFKVLKKN